MRLFGCSSEFISSCFYHSIFILLFIASNPFLVQSESDVPEDGWREAILNRENEFRSRHGAKPLQMLPELTRQAQVWAEQNAADCDINHSSDEESLYKGNSTGENLHCNGGEDVPEEAGNQAADGWYEEIKDYPFTDQYNGEDNLLDKVGHFTQTVWKGSKYVGYGYAYNPECGDSCQQFITARYFPSGNVEGEFGENVQEIEEE